MDDRYEFDHGLEVARKVITENVDFFKLVSSLQDEEKWRNLVGATAFAGCFSTDGDRLSQWCRYADGGRGYAIEFDCKSLLTFGAQGYQFALIRVVYDDACKRDMVRAQIDGALKVFIDSEWFCSDYEPLRSELAQQCAGCMALFNRWDLREEQECRLLRLSKDCKKPCKQPFGREQIRSIVLGPLGDPEQRTEEVQAILTENGFGGVSVKWSRFTPKGNA